MTNRSVLAADESGAGTMNFRVVAAATIGAIVATHAEAWMGPSFVKTASQPQHAAPPSGVRTIESFSATLSNNWIDVPLDGGDAAATTTHVDGEIDGGASSIGEKIREGESAILLPRAVSKEDCDEFAAACSALAAAHRNNVFSPGPDSPSIARLPTRAAAARAAERGTPCAEALSAEMDRACETVLVDILGRIDDEDEEASIAASLLGGIDGISGGGGGTNGGVSDSLREMFLSGELEFSSREPAVNIYVPGGRFLPHRDGQSLTVLVPFSDPDEDFSGGGTAFWSPQDSRAGARESLPSVVLRPPAGTAMLFGGRVTHMGMEVSEGERVVFVASFSRKRAR